MSPTWRIVTIGVVVAVLAGILALAWRAPWMPSIWRDVITASIVAGGVAVGLVLWFEALSKRLAVVGFVSCMTLTGLVIGQTAFGGWKFRGEAVLPPDTDPQKESKPDAQPDSNTDAKQPPNRRIGVEGEAGPASPISWREMLVCGAIVLILLSFSVIFLGHVAAKNGEAELAAKIAEIQKRVTNPGTYGVLSVVIIASLASSSALSRLFNTLLEL